MSSSYAQSGTSSEPVTPTQSTIEHPFANSKSLLEIIPNKIDVEEEARLYDELCDVRYLRHLYLTATAQQTTG